jgi:hypothetical protein
MYGCISPFYRRIGASFFKHDIFVSGYRALFAARKINAVGSMETLAAIDSTPETTPSP